jgi:hypothetical protein
VRRIVSGQGGIQLVAALSAVATWSARSGAAVADAENYLVIYDLFGPPERLDRFVAVLRQLAERLAPWTRVVHLTPEDTSALAGTLRGRGARAAVRRLHELVGTAAVDEIFLIRNWQFGNQLLLNAYRDARKVCYGDGIGLYFDEPPGSAVGTGLPGAARAVLGRWRERARRALGRGRVLDRVGFDVACLALPEALGERPPMQTIPVSRDTLLATLGRARAALDPAAAGRLRARIGDRPVVCLLTSNFAESRRMDAEAEILAYRTFVEGQRVPPGAVAVLKPHPREHSAKVERLATALGPLFADVIPLTEGDHALLPFELVALDVLVGPDLSWPATAQVLTVSGAGLSLALLFGARPVVGFGEAITRRLFRPSHRESRVREERRLQAAITAVAAGVAEGRARP